MSKKYFRAARIVDNVDTVLIAITLGGGAGGIGLLSMVGAAPVVIAMEGVAHFTGFLSIIGKYSVKKSTSKAEKHEKIKTIASTKFNTISSHISKALSDNKVTDEEFQLILEELEKYKVKKEELGQRLRKRYRPKRKNHSSFKGGEKRASPFVGWLKRTIEGIRFRTTKYKCSFSCVVSND